jgi:enoyl-CoA hydratase/carnithine racemase
MGEFVNIEMSDTEGVAIIRLDRPKVNALNQQVGEELLAAATEIEGRDDIKAVVLWGGPKIFAAGADIGAFPIEGEDRDPTDYVMPLIQANNKLENLSQVTVSAVNGVALGGGCELAMATDFRVCGEGARFGQPEILLGIIPGAGGTQRLPRLVGITKAKEINYSGRMVAADEALAIGLVSSVHPDEEVLEAAVAMVAPYVNAPAALKNVKKSMMDGLHLSLSDALEVELREFVASFRTDDAVTGITSFMENGPGKAKFEGS